MGRLTPAIKADDFAELGPEKKGATSFPVAQRMSRAVRHPQFAVHSAYWLTGVAALPCPTPGQPPLPWHGRLQHRGTREVPSLSSLSWLWLSSCWFPFSLLVLPLLGTVSSLPACLIQAGAGWSWR